MKKLQKVIATSLMAFIAILGLAFSADAKSTNHKKVISGQVTSISSSSFVLKTKKKNYTIDVSSSTKLRNKNGDTIKLSDIKDNDTVKATGTLSNSTLSASKVKDKTR